MISFLVAAVMIFSANAQEYIGIKSSDKGECRLYRERFIVDSGQFRGDLKKQVSYREHLIEAGKQKVASLAASYVSIVTEQTDSETKRDKKSSYSGEYNSQTKMISHSMISVDQVEDDVSGKNLFWTFEYCVFDKPTEGLSEKPVGSTGLAQKTFKNPDGSYTIENPKILHAGRPHYIESPDRTFNGSSDYYSALGVPFKKMAFKKLCQRFDFNHFVSSEGASLNRIDFVRVDKKGVVSNADENQQGFILRHLTCR